MKNFGEIFKRRIFLQVERENATEDSIELLKSVPHCVNQDEKMEISDQNGGLLFYF